MTLYCLWKLTTLSAFWCYRFKNLNFLVQKEKDRKTILVTWFSCNRNLERDVHKKDDWRILVLSAHALWLFLLHNDRLWKFFFPSIFRFSYFSFFLLLSFTLFLYISLSLSFSFFFLLFAFITTFIFIFSSHFYAPLSFFILFFPLLLFPVFFFFLFYWLKKETKVRFLFLFFLPSALSDLFLSFILYILLKFFL